MSTYGDDVATANIEVGFMGSPTHRANILGTWAHMGVGAYKAADGNKYYAVLFSIPVRRDGAGADARDDSEAHAQAHAEADAQADREADACAAPRRPTAH